VTTKGTTMRSRLVLGLAAGVLLVTAGCGDDDEDEGFTADERTAVAALTRTMEGSKPDEHEKAQWRCTAEGIVERVGITDLKKSGLLTDDLKSQLNQVKVNPEVASAIGDAYIDCYDIDGVVSRGKEQEARVPAKAWDRYGECLEQHRDKLRASVIEANTIKGGKQAQQAWTKALTACNKALAAQAR